MFADFPGIFQEKCGYLRVFQGILREKCGSRRVSQDFPGIFLFSSWALHSHTGNSGSGARDLAIIFMENQFSRVSGRISECFEDF